MKRLPLIISLLLLMLYSNFIIAATELSSWDDNVFTISDVLNFINVAFGSIWFFWKIVFLFVFHLPSYLIIISFIDTPLGSFLEFGNDGYTATYISIVYWVGGFFLTQYLFIPKYWNTLLKLLFFSPFVILFIGLFFGGWSDQESAFRIMKIDNIECYSLMRGEMEREAMKCLSFF